MKHFTLKTTGTLTLILLTGSLPLFAQSDAGNILKAGSENATKLIKAYTATGIDAAGQGLNDGWNNTAKPLGQAGLDLRMNFGMGIIAQKDQTYDFNALFPSQSSTRLVLEGDVTSRRPTLYGARESTPTKVLVRSMVGGSDTTFSSFALPSGMGFSNSPTLPVLQLSMGFPGNTEVILRHYPSISVSDVQIGLFGIGVKHDIVQWLPKYKHMDINSVRPFDCSVFATFTNFNAGYRKPLLEVDPGAYNPGPAPDYNNQKISLHLNSWTVGAIVSKDYRLWNPATSFAPFLGLNYSSSSSRLVFEGNYPIPVANDEYGPAHPQATRIQNVTDPINISNQVNTMRMNLGARIKLYALTISGEYSIGTINTVSVSVGANIQSLKPYNL